MVKIIKRIISTESLTQSTHFSMVLDLECLGWESGFYQRRPNKITSTALLGSFWQMHQSGKNTLKDWTSELAKSTGEIISEQALNERLNERAVNLAKRVLKKALNLKTNKKTIKKKKKAYKKFLKLFNRILIRDSTSQKLPSHLHKVFKGSHSKGEPTAMMRIQALFNFTEEQWEDFQIGAYTDNDQSAADSISEILQKKDLILQDLGYFTLDWLEQVIEDQFIITRYRKGVHVFDEQGVQLDLVELLANRKQVDMEVLVGAKKRLPLRLVARKLPAKKARKRIKEAKKDRHSKANHSKEYYKLLEYEIYLTNVEKQVLNGKEIAKLYGLRWHIEILFKSWKSHANFKTLFEKRQMKLERVLFTIYAVLVEFVYLQNCIFKYVKNQLKYCKNKFLSPLKFMDIVHTIFSEIINVSFIHQLQHRIPLFLAKATYKKHSKRKNTIEKYLYVNELCIKLF